MDRPVTAATGNFAAVGFGIVLGPMTHVLVPDALFGDLLFPLVSLSVAIILFEGALTLRIDEIRGLGGVVRNLVTVGMLITFVVISLACWLLLRFPPELAALVGAVTVVTGPTVIAPLMRVVRPNAAINRCCAGKVSSSIPWALFLPCWCLNSLCCVSMLNLYRICSGRWA